MATYYVDGAVGGDSNAGTSPGAGNAWATIAHALATMASGDLVYVKASAVYSIGTGLTAANGTYNQVTRLVGYTATPGDFGRPTIRATAAITGLTITALLFRLENFILDGNATGTVGVSITGFHGNSLVNCLIESWTGEAVMVVSVGAASVLDCEVKGCGGTNGAVAANSSIAVSGCNIHGNSASGVYLSGTCSVVTDCRIWGNTGASSDGIACTQYGNHLSGNTIHGNGRHGVNLEVYNIQVGIRDNIITSNGGYGIANPASPSAIDLAMDYNWVGSGSLANVSGPYSGMLAGPHDASGDPQYVNASTGDFTPQNAPVQAGSP